MTVLIIDERIIVLLAALNPGLCTYLGSPYTLECTCRLCISYYTRFAFDFFFNTNETFGIQMKNNYIFNESDLKWQYFHDSNEPRESSCPNWQSSPIVQVIRKILNRASLQNYYLSLHQFYRLLTNTVGPYSPVMPLEPSLPPKKFPHYTREREFKVHLPSHTPWNPINVTPGPLASCIS